MTCPRCGQGEVESPACPRCGVIFAKLRPPKAEPRIPAASAASSTHSPIAGRVLLLGLAVLAGALFLARRPGPPPPPAATPGPSSDPAPEAAPLLPAMTAEAASSPPPAAVLPPSASLPDADAETFVLLAGRLQARARISAPDLESGEALLRRHPEEPAAKALVASLLATVAVQDRVARQPALAAERLRRAILLRPDDSEPRSALVAALLEASDWTGAEAAARDLLARSPRHPEALRALGFALMRQDRSREAQEALRASLEAREDPATRALFERVQKAQSDERGMREQHLAHFNVRYDGETHEDVGREILRALERHYATLARTFDHQPASTIPVVLFSEQSYFDATGAPFWSGGQYSHFDGRVSIPIGGLSPALTPTLDDVLIHEVGHAFIGDISRGVAPRDIHEGLAQYLEGRRVDSALGSAGLRALSEGRMSEVQAFYYSALAFVEQLQAERGQGGINDLLRAMGETGNVDEAFRRVYGRDHNQAALASSDRLRQQHAR